MKTLLAIAIAATAITATAITACGSDTLAPSPSSVNGSWFAPGEVAGSSDVWTLAVNGHSITGTGTWSGEACCSGTTAISGTVTNDSVHLDLTYTIVQGAVRPPFHERFDGSLIAPDTLQGTLVPDGADPLVVQRVRR